VHALARITLVLSTAALVVAEDAATVPPAPDGGDARLGGEIAAILRADYRGDRAELARRAGALAPGEPGERGALRAYWAGFAWWRRGMNGFYERPLPQDVVADFERCAVQERAALAREPGLDEARAALAGCLGGTAFALPQGEPRAALLRESNELLRELEPRAAGNPRLLWMEGGRLMAPPDQGGDLARAAATFRKGLEAARAEALGPPRAPGLPAWGAPENLMSLAFVHTIGPRPQREVARAYAEGALAMVPDWHFVRDVLLPRIEALPAPAATPP
jgi:hypothetical protein